MTSWKIQSLPIVSIISVLPQVKKRERERSCFQDTDLYKWLEAVAYTIAGGRGEHLEELADRGY
ncbi:MAG: hypothetical protein ACLRIP_11160 [Blautia massiliensis (ex Durand et al. 2017)]